MGTKEGQSESQKHKGQHSREPFPGLSMNESPRESGRDLLSGPDTNSWIGHTGESRWVKETGLDDS